MPLTLFAPNILYGSEGRFIRDTCGMDHTMQVSKTLINLLNYRLHLVLISHISLQYHYFRSQLFQSLDALNLASRALRRLVILQPLLPCMTSRQIRMPHQDESGLHRCCQVCGQHQTNVPQTTGDQVDTLLSQRWSMDTGYPKANRSVGLYPTYTFTIGYNWLTTRNINM